MKDRETLLAPQVSARPVPRDVPLRLRGFALSVLLALSVSVSSCGGDSAAPVNTPAPPPAVQVAASITTDPAAATVVDGQATTFQVTASGTAPLSYQWKRNGTHIPGATAATYSIPAVAWDDHGALFSVTVSNAALPAGVTSSAARLSLRPSTAGLVCTDGQTGWCWANPRPTGLRLTGVAYAGSALVAVSVDEGIIRSTDGGATWSSVTQPWGVRFRSVAFASATVGVAVGDGGEMLRSTDGGVSWGAVASGTTQHLTGVAFATATIGVAVGGSLNVLRTTDGGATWTPVALPGVMPPTAIAFNGNGGAIVVGSGAAYVSNDNGASWAAPSSILVMTSVAYASNNVAVAVGTFGSMIRTIDGGQTWAPVNSATNRTFGGVAFSSSSVGVAVAASGTIVRTIDAGATWVVVDPGEAIPTGNFLSSVAMTAGGNAVAVGPGMTVRSSDTGLTWASVASGPSGPASTWFGVAFADERFGVAVGGNAPTDGAIARTQDGGRTWASVPIDPTTSLNGVAFASASVGVAVGGFGTILRTSDAGASWRTASSPPTNARLMAVTFLTPTVGIAVGTVPATILRTADGGATWTEVTPNTITQPLWSVATIDSNRALAVGDGGGYASNDGGVTWMAVPAGIGTQLVAVSFADASRGAVIAGDATVRRTSDGGATWVAVNNLAKLPFGTGIALKGTNGVTVGFGMSSNNVTFGGLQTTADAAATLVTDSVPIYPLRGVAMPSASVAVVVGENGVIMIRSSGN